VDFKYLLSETGTYHIRSVAGLRKDTADAEGVPAYTLFTNEQLADMV
jgi:hypothetical protein